MVTFLKMIKQKRTIIDYDYGFLEIQGPKCLAHWILWLEVAMVLNTPTCEVAHLNTEYTLETDKQG